MRTDCRDGFADIADGDMVVGLALSTLPAIAFAFLYFVGLLAYVAYAFRQGALAAGGVTHWRMLHAGLGALLLALVFVLAALISILSDPPARLSQGSFPSPRWALP